VKNVADHDIKMVSKNHLRKPIAIHLLLSQPGFWLLAPGSWFKSVDKHKLCEIYKFHQFA